jgi:hypothetical protein
MEFSITIPVDGGLGWALGNVGFGRYGGLMS